MKKTLSLALLLCMAWATEAKPVTPSQAATVARTFWIENLHGKADAALVDLSAKWPYSGIYLFSNPDGGFVMVAADDAVRPILGYSPTGTIDPGRLPVQLSQWLDEYQRHIDWVRHNDGLAYPSDTQAWQSLLAGVGLKDGDGPGVEPLLSTLWDQWAPFNELCPPNTVSGCVATAMAMVMKYWNHPAFGQSSHSYTHPTYGVQSADFTHTLYDWAYMPDLPTSASPERERMAVATLLYHCGVAVEMQYGTAAQGGSAAIGLIGMEGYPSVDNALKDYFFYNPSMTVVHRDAYAYTNAQWRDMLIDELNQRHPILYTGQSEAGGHAFVCDGYDSRQYMHFNFGWSGDGDGYYPVDSISPGHGGVGGNVTYTFNYYNAALFGATPFYGLRVSDTLLSFSAGGGNEQFLLSVNPTLNARLTMECDADWLTIDTAGLGSAGWVKVRVDGLSAALERVAIITFRQGSEVCRVRVAQTGYSPADFCPVTVVMDAIQGDGWQNNAHLVLQSRQGYIFGSVALTQGDHGIDTILVAPHDVMAVWHSGGGTDRHISYVILNHYGEELVNVQRAYNERGPFYLDWPCSHVGIESTEPAAEWTVYPNPVLSTLYLEGIAEPKVAVYVSTVNGCRKQVPVRKNTVDLNGYEPGVYILEVVTDKEKYTAKVIKK